jgi:hypothetical protein
MRIRSGLALSVVAAAAVASCGGAPSHEEQREAKKLLRSAVDAIHRERRTGFVAHLELRLVPRESHEQGATMGADIRGSYEAGGRLALRGRWNIFGREFNGRMMHDPQVGTFAYDPGSLQWYGDRSRATDRPEEGLRRFVADVLLNGYPATLDERGRFGDPLDRLVKRVIELYGERVVELSLEDGDAVDGASTVVVRLDPKPDEIVKMVRRRGTSGPEIEDALEKVVGELELEMVLGEKDHLPREVRTALTLEDLEIPSFTSFERVELDVSLSLFDWGKEFDISPPFHFEPLYELSAFAPD